MPFNVLSSFGIFLQTTVRPQTAWSDTNYHFWLQKHSFNTGAKSKLAVWVAKQSKQTSKNVTTVNKQLENIESNWYQGEKKHLDFIIHIVFQVFFKKSPSISLTGG